MGLRGIQEGVAIALESLRQSKIRTGLTVLGVAVGVVVVVAMAAVIQGINESFEEAIEAAGPKTFYVVKASGIELNTGLEEEDPKWLTRPPLQASFVRELDRLSTVENAYPIADLSWIGIRLRAEGNDIQSNLLAVPPDFLLTDAGDITAGRWYTALEEAAGRPVVVIDSSAARDLFGGRVDAVGKGVRIGSQRYEVIGIYQAPPNLFAQLGNHRVFVPFTTAEKYLMRNARWIAFEDLIQYVVVARPAVTLVHSLDQVMGRLRALRNLGPGQENDFELLTQDQIYDMWNQITAALFAVMFALSSVGLMVGGVGVIAVMVVSVTERTREIGIRKAMGARRRDVLWQFLVEAATLTTVGGAFGLAAGGLIAWAIAHFSPVPASIPLWSIVLALAASAFTGIVFGMYPAMRASRLDPVVALRYE